MNKCPRCENEELREGQNFCQICGLNLKELKMTRAEAIKHLEGLKCEALELSKDNEGWVSEIAAIEVGIEAIKRLKELERTAQEVPVQEQLIKVTLDGSEIAKSLAIHDKV